MSAQRKSLKERMNNRKTASLTTRQVKDLHKQFTKAGYSSTYDGETLLVTDPDDIDIEIVRSMKMGGYGGVWFTSYDGDCIVADYTEVEDAS